MQEEEKQLIDGLFDRLRQAEEQTGPRHAEAEAVITEALRKQPAAPYYMTQAILIQEHALEQLNQRVQELEEELSQRPPAQQSSGSFLGGLFGANKAESAPPPAVPQRRFQPPPGVAPAGGGMGGSAQPLPGAAAQPNQGGGGSFMGGAMQTAVAVAGGLVIGSLLANMLFGDDADDALADAADAVDGIDGLGEGGEQIAAVSEDTPVSYDDDLSDSGGAFEDMGDFGDFDD